MNSKNSKNGAIVKVKICGITNIDDAKLCVDCGADALGFIFYKESKRYIEPDKAKKIIDKLPFFVLKVGVFVNEIFENVNATAKNIGLNAVQLHGNENLDYFEKINYPVLKAIRVDEKLNENLKIYSDYTILLDSKDASEYGGTGKQFDWALIPESYLNKIILAGGVSEENIDDIFYRIKPQAVDLSSSLEREPGIKDHKKVKSFFNKVNKLNE
ncbi:MAG: phosphoribosylanthranilate isomerase [Melioribacteraceae bacterium]|nr:phosphoribosylanthranilate isomerase [Melioribacteraceae bacterium]